MSSGSEGEERLDSSVSKDCSERWWCSNRHDVGMDERRGQLFCISSKMKGRTSIHGGPRVLLGVRLRKSRWGRDKTFRDP